MSRACYNVLSSVDSVQMIIHYAFAIDITYYYAENLLSVSQLQYTKSNFQCFSACCTVTSAHGLVSRNDAHVGFSVLGCCSLCACHSTSILALYLRISSLPNLPAKAGLCISNLRH